MVLSFVHEEQKFTVVHLLLSCRFDPQTSEMLLRSCTSFVWLLLQATLGSRRVVLLRHIHALTPRVRARAVDKGGANEAGGRLRRRISGRISLDWDQGLR